MLEMNKSIPTDGVLESPEAVEHSDYRLGLNCSVAGKTVLPTREVFLDREVEEELSAQPG